MIRRCEGTAVCSLDPLGNLLSVLSAHVLKPLTLCVFASPVSLYRTWLAQISIKTGSRGESIELKMTDMTTSKANFSIMFL